MDNYRGNVAESSIATERSNKKSQKRAFQSLEGSISENTLNAIKDMGFTKMTKIQAKAIPPLLEGHDVVGSAKFGSGKTFASLISAVELITKHKPKKSTRVIVLTAERELAKQTHSALSELVKYHDLTHDLLMGGKGNKSKKLEKEKLSKGINILISTPARLLYHLQHTPEFKYNKLRCLVIDDADKILANGFEGELEEIIKLLPSEKRQTILFTTTTNEKTQALMKLAFKKEPVYVGINDDKKQASGLEHGYVVCPTDSRLVLLFKILALGRLKKVIVFFSTGTSVKFHHELFNYTGNPVMSIQAQDQDDKADIFSRFSELKSGHLFCSDLAVKGVNIPAVDCIIQYDPPKYPKEYINRLKPFMEGGKTQALLILRPEELEFVKYMKEDFKVTLQECVNLDVSNLEGGTQTQLEEIVKGSYLLTLAAEAAFETYTTAYKSHNLTNIFDITTLDLRQVATSFALRRPPPPGGMRKKLVELIESQKKNQKAVSSNHRRRRR